MSDGKVTLNPDADLTSTCPPGIWRRRNLSRTTTVYLCSIALYMCGQLSFLVDLKVEVVDLCAFSAERE